MAPPVPHLLLAYDGSPSADAAARAAAVLFPGAQTSRATVPGHGAAAALLTEAHRVGADVVACGTRGRGALARAVLGSTSTALLHETDLPLLVVPEGDVEPEGPVLLAFDGSDGAGRAIRAVARLMPGRAAVVVHAWEPMAYRSLEAHALDAGGSVDRIDDVVTGLQGTLADRAAQITEAGLGLAQAAGLAAVADTTEVTDTAWRAIAGAARTHRAQAIVVGSRGLGAARAALEGSVSAELIRHAGRPVLVVPA